MKQHKPDTEPNTQVVQLIHITESRDNFFRNVILMMKNLSIVMATIVNDDTDMLTVHMNDNALQPMGKFK